MVNIANALVRRARAVDVLVLSAQGPLISDLDGRVRLVDLATPRFRRAFVPLVRYLRRVRPDALLACMWPLTSMALWARSVSRVSTRVVVAEHTTWSAAAAELSAAALWTTRWTMRLSFPHADGIVSVSRGAADDLAAFTGIDRGKVEAIYNPVVGSEPVYDATPREPLEWWSGGDRRILAVGTLKAVKDYTTLLSAFAILRRRMPVRLLILGEGECRKTLEGHARSLGIADAVHMPGYVPDPRPYYSRADLHVLTSRAEGLANVVIEALAAGTPVVSTDCPCGPREILRDGLFGALVPVGDVTALAAEMATALTKEHDRSALRERARDFTIDKAVDRYESLLFPGPGAGT